MQAPWEGSDSPAQGLEVGIGIGFAVEAMSVQVLARVETVGGVGWGSPRGRLVRSQAWTSSCRLEVLDLEVPWWDCSFVGFG